MKISNVCSLVEDETEMQMSNRVKRAPGLGAGPLIIGY